MKAISLTWDGETHIIKPNQAFEAAEVVERHMSLMDVAKIKDNLPLTKLARCYADLVEFAGGYAEAAEVHSVMMQQMKAQAVMSSDGAQSMLVVKALQDLVEILMDGAPEMEEPDGEKKKVKVS